MFCSLYVEYSCVFCLPVSSARLKLYSNVAMYIEFGQLVLKSDSA